MTVENLTDEELLAIIGTPEKSSLVSAIEKIAQPEAVRQFGRGVKSGLKERALGVGQLIASELPISDEIKQDMTGLADLYKMQRGTGLSSLAGEIIGDPFTYMPVLNAPIAGGISGGTLPVGRDDSRALNTAIGAGTGYALQKLLPLAKAGTKEASKVDSGDVRKLASQAYQLAEDKGGTLASSFTDNFVSEVDKVMPQTKAGKMLSGKSALSSVVEDIKSLKGSNISLKEAQEIDEFLSDTIDNFMDAGRITKQGKKLLDIQTSFRRMIDAAPESQVVGGKEGFEALKEGRRLWSASAKMRDIEKIISRAEMTDNPATAIKSGFRTLYNNEARMRGFTDKERELIKKAANTGSIEALRGLGSRLIGIITATTQGVPQGLTAMAGSAAARKAASKIQTGKAEKVTEEIASRALNLPTTSTGWYDKASAKVGAGARKASAIAAQTAPKDLKNKENNPYATLSDEELLRIINEQP